MSSSLGHTMEGIIGNLCLSWKPLRGSELALGSLLPFALWRVNCSVSYCESQVSYSVTQAYLCSFPTTLKQKIKELERRKIMEEKRKQGKLKKGFKKRYEEFQCGDFFFFTPSLVFHKWSSVTQVITFILCLLKYIHGKRVYFCDLHAYI